MFFLFCLQVTRIVFSLTEVCTLLDYEKLDCGYPSPGSDQVTCESYGCCWYRDETPGVPWCYRNTSQGSCFVLQNDLQEPFNSSELSVMRDYFLANINVESKGGVVAAPDLDTPGGSYYFHWMRDGALTIKSLQDTLPKNYSYDSIEPILRSFVSWVLKAQSLPPDDTNNIDVRIEPKFLLPDCALFTDPWCRPQNDGPGLQVY